MLPSPRPLSPSPLTSVPSSVAPHWGTEATLAQAPGLGSADGLTGCTLAYGSGKGGWLHKALLWGCTALHLHVSVAGAELTLRWGECCLPGWLQASSLSRAMVLGSPPLPLPHWAGCQAPRVGPHAKDVQGQVGGRESRRRKPEGAQCAWPFPNVTAWASPPRVSIT